jgi:uncharacterized protein (DUF433 family)
LVFASFCLETSALCWLCEFGTTNALVAAAGGATIPARYDSHVQELQRITIDPDVMGGKPCIRGMRVTVGMIVESLAAGQTIEQLLADFPYLEEPDIREALAFAARLAQGHEIRLAS